VLKELEGTACCSPFEAMNLTRLRLQQHSVSLVVKASNHSQQMKICITGIAYMLGALGITLHKLHHGLLIAPGADLYSSEEQLFEGHTCSTTT